MLRALGLSVLLFALACAVPGRPKDWKDPDLGNYLLAGAATRDSLWLLGETRIVRFDRKTSERRAVEGQFQDLLADGKGPWALERTDAGQPARIRNLADGASLSTPALPGTALYLFRLAGRIGVLTDKVIAAPKADGGWRVLKPATAEFLNNGRPTILAVGDRLLIGFDKGEFGGGLAAIDLATGQTSQIEDRGAGDLCEGLLNPDCDPVQAMIVDPARPDCALVAVGLAHLSTTGRIVRVCKNGVTLVHHARKPGPSRLFGEDWPLSSLAALPDGWVAAAEDERLLISRGGRVASRPLPHLKAWAGLRINDSDPRFIVVMKACCWGSADNPTDFDVLVVPVT